MKIYLSALFTFFCVSIYAQDVVFKYEKKFKSAALAKSYKSFVAYDESTGELHLTITDNKSTERFVLDSNWQIKSQVNTVRGAYAEFPYDRFNTLQLLSAGNKEINIYNIDATKFYINQIDYINKKETNIQKFELQKRESLDANFTTNNIFCLIVAGKRESELKFITNAKSKGLVLDTLLVNLNGYDSDVSLTKFMSNTALLEEDERDLQKLAQKNKIYLQGNKVYISIDKADGAYVTCVDLTTGEIKHSNFAQRFAGTLQKVTKPTLYNSFLYGNIFVTGNAYNLKMSLTFYDFAKESYIKNYTAEEKDGIGFKTGRLLNKKDKEITNAEFFRKISSSEALVFELCERNKNELELIVDVCDVVIPRSYGGGYWSSTGSFQTPGGSIPAAPMYHSFGNWTTDENIVTKNSYFKSVLNAETLTANPEAPDVKSLSGILEEELKKLDSNSALSLFRRNNILYLGFYDDKQEAFIIKKIGQ